MRPARINNIYKYETNYSLSFTQIIPFLMTLNPSPLDSKDCLIYCIQFYFFKLYKENTSRLLNVV